VVVDVCDGRWVSFLCEFVCVCVRVCVCLSLAIQALHLSINQPIDSLNQHPDPPTNQPTNTHTHTHTHTHSRLYCWGYGDGGWLGLEHAAELPYVEPCPPVTKYGATCSFDSDFNACLPARVTALSHVKVEKVVAGGGHTIIMGRRIQRRFSRAGGAREVREEGGEGGERSVSVDVGSTKTAGLAEGVEAMSLDDDGGTAAAGGGGGGGGGRRANGNSLNGSTGGSTSNSSSSSSSSSSFSSSSMPMR
jgi:hypothetical protein